MPRKEWIPKNPYCRRSKLNGEDFFILLDVYFGEVLYKFTREAAHNDFNLDYLKHKPPAKEKLSYQALSINFSKIGQYLWDNIVVKENPQLKDKKVLDEFFDLLYGKIDEISTHRNVYNTLDKFPLFLNAENITGSLMFYLLSSRSTDAKGFKKDAFYIEFSRVYYICMSADKFRDEITSIYSSTAFSTRTGILIESKWSLCEILKKKPIGT